MHPAAHLICQRSPRTQENHFIYEKPQVYEKPQKSPLFANVRLFHRRHFNPCVRSGWIREWEMQFSNTEHPDASQ